MLLRCLGHKRIMFGMFSAHFKPRNTIGSHISAVLTDFQYKFVKNGFFGLKNDSQTRVIQNTPCRFVCVCCTDMRQRAFESPDLGQCFKYPHHRCWVPRKFFTDPRRSGSQFFSARSGKIQKISGGQKTEKSGFWWSKWLEKNSKCFWGVWDMKESCLGCFQLVSSPGTPLAVTF